MYMYASISIYYMQIFYNMIVVVVIDYASSIHVICDSLRYWVNAAEYPLLCLMLRSMNYERKNKVNP